MFQAAALALSTAAAGLCFKSQNTTNNHSLTVTASIVQCLSVCECVCVCVCVSVCVCVCVCVCV